MDISQRKYNLIELVMQLNDKDLLLVEDLLKLENLKLIHSLNVGLKQVEAKDYRSHAEVKKKYEKWL